MTDERLTDLFTADELQLIAESLKYTEDNNRTTGMIYSVFAAVSPIRQKLSDLHSRFSNAYQAKRNAEWEATHDEMGNPIAGA